MKTYFTIEPEFLQTSNPIIIILFDAFCYDCKFSKVKKLSFQSFLIKLMITILFSFSFSSSEAKNTMYRTFDDPTPPVDTKSPNTSKP